MLPTRTQLALFTCLLVAAFCAPVRAGGEQCKPPVGVPFQSTAWVETRQVEKFDPNRGVLTGVRLVFTGTIRGQAAYESGYGTSRFAAEGNALFGQWTYGGEGLVPEQQRSNLGDHRIAAYEWPFDSVRSYFLNLSSHPAYEDLRRLRAELKASGKPVTSMADILMPLLLSI